MSPLYGVSIKRGFSTVVFLVVARELNGIIVTLDELGNLQCSYLGTDPTSHAGVGGVKSKQSLEVNIINNY